MASNDADKPTNLNPETAPDPDEDDLDDLDDMLDDFASTKISPPPPQTQPSSSTTPGPSGPGRPAAAAPLAELDPNPKAKAVSDTSGDGEVGDFTEQLQAGMAEMLRDLESNPEMAKQFEELMAQFGAPPPPGGAVAGATLAGAQPAAQPRAAPASKPGEENFQDTIKRTMDRMKASSSSASAASSAPNPADDDMMAALMRELANAEGGGEGDETFSKMLLGMMEQLTNKEILYEPMKELDTKFPGWLEEHGAGLNKEDRERYEGQKGLVREIVGRFERSGYSDTNADDREFIVDRMQKMQAAGAPPPDLVGDVNAAEEMFGNAETGCPQQ